MSIREERIGHIVVGSGAAGYAAALRLWQLGERDVALLTEDRSFGTSRNTGSDKQTYYKLSLAAGDPDSVLDMAKDLFAGGCVDGDQALCEAALSTRCFYYLRELGVPFPATEYGEYLGYKTDHDRGRRATSAGPYTSKLMTEALERAAASQGIPVRSGLQLIKILVRDGAVRGILCLERRDGSPECRLSDPGADVPGCATSFGQGESSYILVWCRDLILATGGPAGLYRDSVYPASQLGSSGLAFEAGARGKNLTEWQFGLASLRPRWNVSGSYMQVLPRFLSTDAQGGDAREFLTEAFADPGELESLVFLKGYQWPFDVNKLDGDSSVIDLMVYRESVLRGRRVFLDFTTNPGGGSLMTEGLSEEALEYLRGAGALFGTPIERLLHMNAPAVAFYKEHGVDLAGEWLEIAVSAQHNNGGIATDAHWESDVQGLYVVGEAAGTHGVTRPGGSALNAGQVGALRAAEAIHHKAQRADEGEGMAAPVRDEALAASALSFIAQCEAAQGERTPGQLWQALSADMSRVGGMIRQPEGIRAALAETEKALESFPEALCPVTPQELPLYYHLRDMLMARRVYLAAMLNYMEEGGASRGSALYTDPEGALPRCGRLELPELFRYRLDDGKHSGVVQEVGCGAFPEAAAAGTSDTAEGDGMLGVSESVGKIEASESDKTPPISCWWRPVRPIPSTDYVFENQWRAFREREGIGSAFEYKQV